MSGVRDRVNEAAERLEANLPIDALAIYRDDLETIFDYLLGEDRDKPQPLGHPFLPTHHIAGRCGWEDDGGMACGASEREHGRMQPKIEPTAGAAVVDLAELVFKFAQVERITLYPDGHRPESDTDHTVMLALVATAFATRYLPNLDEGLIALYALVHDLPEVHAGDTPTLHQLNGDEAAAKRRREQDAADQIAAQFDDSFPWIGFILADYECQDDPESRYVRAMDKLMPKLTHILNEGSTLALQGVGKVELLERLKRQREEMLTYAADFPETFELMDQLIGMMFEAAFASRVEQVR